ncbi:TNF receptor-associated factor 4-like isoform X1 [Limulus polyphemus]|uniref:TNF receptor-associated factor 4-like isoform X1 n=2 Tax=Limulus polyphemus TaxID=6850 RepID=A0ABM1BCK0_LIMPO|nr:TNF receptor-associated factor 4-like isoform X1 [Limulus polyphemus]
MGDRAKNGQSVRYHQSGRERSIIHMVDPDLGIEPEIMGSLVYCIHFKDGCRWMDELKKLKGHLNTCKYDAIPCTSQCGAMIPKLMMEDHLMYTCPNRRLKCELCGREVTAEVFEDHMATCQYEPVHCENKCGCKIQRRFISTHRQKECTKRLVACRFCNKEFVYDTLQLHSSKCPRYLVLCPNRCDSSKIARENLEFHLKECPSLIMCCGFKEMGCKFKGPRFAMEQHMETAGKAHLLLMCGVVSHQQHQISNLCSALSSLAVNTSGVLVWRIADYSQKLAEAKTKESYELSSSPFYTSQYGYKLMATLFPNGNGAGEGTHLSVYIRILPGEYDPLLPWPFSHTVSFTLYDQANSPAKATNIVESFVPDPSWENFQRPSKEPNALGFGFPCFVSHEMLKKRNFVKDNTIYIKIRVDPSKIIAV